MAQNFEEVEKPMDFPPGFSSGVPAPVSSSTTGEQNLPKNTQPNPPPSFYSHGFEVDSVGDISEKKSPVSETPHVKLRGISRYRRHSVFRSAGRGVGFDPPAWKSAYDLQTSLPRAIIRLPCPGRDCNCSEVLEWFCSSCNMRLEYGFTGNKVYCDCDCVSYAELEFKCTSEHHGDQFVSFRTRELLDMLTDLRPMSELNILILGETGVGKSTFINSFINYITFEGLAEAQRAMVDDRRLRWVIPCSFRIQELDQNMDYIEHKIQIGKIGHGGDRGPNYDNAGTQGFFAGIKQRTRPGAPGEDDGSGGQSATQKTGIYSITVEDTLIHLIDTPGIGDTRGVEKDADNMRNIVSTIAQFQVLHGILILIKSNSPRLGIQFRYCLHDLLAHLHKDAIQNMAFGFTNTRVSNYTPGDVFAPLQYELRKYPNMYMGLKIGYHTSYCLDSESFRYLAAKSNNISMSNEEDFRRSWDHSSRESHRLINYFRNCPPHVVQSTLHLNRAIELVKQLTKPIAEISYRIQLTVRKNKQNIQDLRDSELAGNDLQGKLYFTKFGLRYQEREKPRTVCSHEGCLTYENVDGQDGVKVYRRPCHDPCYLEFETDKVGVAGIESCAAFQNRRGGCSVCRHKSEYHLHVKYDHIEETNTIKDENVEKLLRENADEVTDKKAAIAKIEAEIADCEDAERQLQEAAAQFCFFLKEYSITTYSDVMIQYLDHLIREETNTVTVTGCSRDRLNGLEANRQEYKQKLKIIELALKNPNIKPLDSTGVDKLVQKLYKLKHWGQSLQDIIDIIQATESKYTRSPYGYPSAPKFGSSTGKEQTSTNRVFFPFKQERSQTSTVSPPPYYPGQSQNNPTMHTGAAVQEYKSLLPPESDYSVYDTDASQVPRSEGQSLELRVSGTRGQYLQSRNKRNAVSRAVIRLFGGDPTKKKSSSWKSDKKQSGGKIVHVSQNTSTLSWHKNTLALKLFRCSLA